MKITNVVDLAWNTNVVVAATFEKGASGWTCGWENEWPLEPPAGDVEFGGGVCVKVNSKTGATNAVSFTSIDFKPGETSTFKMSGFDASTQSIPDFNMWFVVCDTLGGPTRYVKVDAEAFNSTTGELTVTLPAGALEKDGGGTHSSFFILGIDNNKGPNPGE